MSEPAQEARIATARRAGFYPLMLLLERLDRDRAPVGTAESPMEEGVRFRHDPALAFPAGDVQDLKLRTGPLDPDTLERGKDVYEITTTFLGLSGSASPLPAYFGEEVAQDEGERTRDFLDIFHHRLLSLLYRALARYDFPNGFSSDGSDAWSRRLVSLAGFDVERKPLLPAWRLLRLAPLLNDGEVTASALEVALEDVLGSDLAGSAVRVEQFVGTWAPLEASELTRLGRTRTRLGRDVLLGRSVFDRAGRFRIVIGPLGRASYLRFQEGSDALRRIAGLVETILPGTLEYEVVLWLDRDAAPCLELSSAGRTRLGKDSWLGGQRREARIPVRVPHVA
ncbi:MAG: type VI secretion system baseplate subunit TssG [Myxococcales bacterium]